MRFIPDLLDLNNILNGFRDGRPPAPLPARRAYRPEGRAYGSESNMPIVYQRRIVDASKKFIL